ncbi:ceramide-1-phosphate transfer protein [Thrips palmi]|uniref:Ceramide-1-phosphate transfer protein n=1 Tax=Thrips palmi TaxID=161013 RepID=A0A6P8YSK5_THRPL|nr:ceramide-1-phosphate transfer protein [Thrips palmi]
MAESPSTELPFDFRLVHDGFASALVEDEDVDLQHYLTAYKELFKFFQLMGTVFSFVGSDVKSKIDILEDLSNSSDGHHFTSVKKMIIYEKGENLLKKKDYVSGSRTLLRLHRGLDFIKLFLKRVGELSDSDSTYAAGSEAYTATLAKHHPWLVRKGATVAMYALPTRQDLLIKVCGSNEACIQRALDVLPKMLLVADEVFTRTEQCYTEHDLHSLP